MRLMSQHGSALGVNEHLDSPELQAVKDTFAEFVRVLSAGGYRRHWADDSAAAETKAAERFLDAIEAYRTTFDLREDLWPSRRTTLATTKVT